MNARRESEATPMKNRTRTIGEHWSRWVTRHSARFANPNK